MAGCGRLVESGYLPALARFGDIELVGLADPDRPRRERLASRAATVAGAPVAAYAEVEEMLARQVDLLVVATPPELHVRHAELGASAGAVTLVEKPPAATLAGARRLAALKPAPWIGFNRRFSLLPRLDGTASPGPLRIVLRLSYRRPSWGAYEVRDDALRDLGPHLVDLALAIGGPLRALRRAELAPRRALLELELERGTASIVCETDRPWREAVEVRAEGGALIARSAMGGPLRGALARLRRGPHPLAASLAAQLGALASAARGGDPGRLASAADGVAAMEVLDAAERR